MLPLFAFIVISLVAFGLGQVLNWFNFVQNAPLDAQLGGLAIFMISTLAFLLVANQMKDLKSLQAMTWTILGIGTFYIFVTVIPPLLSFRPLIFQANAIGGIFWAWLPALALSQALFNRDLHWSVRLGLVVVTIATLYNGLVLNFRWKSGWVPSLLSVATILFFWSWRLVLGLGVIGILPMLKFASDVISSDSYSVSTRVDAWIILSQIIKANPILGLGFANYYWYTPLFPIRGWAVNFNSHNNYVDLIAQTGLAGLACFLWLFWELGRSGLGLLQRVPDGFPKAYVYGAIGGLVGTLAAAMLGDWLLPFVYNIGLNGVRTGILAWLFLGGLVVLEQLYPVVKSNG